MKIYKKVYWLFFTFTILFYCCKWVFYSQTVIIKCHLPSNPQPSKAVFIYWQEYVHEDLVLLFNLCKVISGGCSREVLFLRGHFEWSMSLRGGDISGGRERQPLVRGAALGGQTVVTRLVRSIRVGEGGRTQHTRGRYTLLKI